MRVVIDMQGAQSEASAWRGVGRYAREMAKNLILSGQEEIEVFLALNGKLDCESIFEYFEGILPRDHMKVWYYEPEVGPASTFDHDKKHPIELFYEWFLHQFQADVIWIPNFQEGYDEANIATCTKLTRGTETVISTLHDVIPLLFKEDYLRGDITAWYEKKLKYVVDSDVVLTVSDYSKEKISELLGIEQDKIHVISNGYDHNAFFPDKAYLRAENKEKYFLCVGGSGVHKNLISLFRAFSKLDISYRNAYPLVLVGKEPLAYQAELMKEAIELGIDPEQLKLTGFVTDDELLALMQRCTGFVFPSYSEGFGLPPLEAMACGAPVLAANAASLKEIVQNEDALFDPMDSDSLGAKMLRLIQDRDYADSLIQSGLERAKAFSWESAGRELKNLILQCPRATNEHPYSKEELCSDLLPLLEENDFRYKAELARSIERSTLFSPTRHIYVDASSVVLLDYVTGIQRVVNGIASSLKEMYAEDDSVEVQVVYSDPATPNFHYAVYDRNHYIRQKKHKSSAIVGFHDGDVLLMPDLHLSNIYAKKDYLSQLSKNGVRVITILHDLIPVDYPDFYDKSFILAFQNYLFAISQFSGVIGDSEASLCRYLKWCKENKVEFPPCYLQEYNHIGCDIAKANPSLGLPEDAGFMLDLMSSKPTVLMVGTIEPRKKHEQVLSAMETLWADGKDINLVFVGRYGWNMEEFQETMKDHPEKDKHFFWLKGISDEYLEKVYDAGTGVIMSSVAEGYGLPIIEAAQHGKPLLLRDIPVFREIAGENALYFQEDDADSLGKSIEEWLERIKLGTAGNPAEIKSYTWEESTRNLLTMIDEFFSQVHEKDDGDSEK